jgi:hypothetical protein
MRSVPHLCGPAIITSNPTSVNKPPPFCVSPTASQSDRSPPLASSNPTVARPSSSGLSGFSLMASLAYWCGTGAGASPLFPPQHATAEAAKDQLLHLVRRDPRSCQVACTRWTLVPLRTQAPWLRLSTDASLHRLLARLGICRKRARSYIRSPDQHYDAKLADLAAIQARVQTEPDRFVLLYLDEVTSERQPSRSSLPRAWAP